MIPEEDLTADGLADHVEALYKNRETYKEAMQSRNESDAVAAIVKLIEAHSNSF
ncbi:undecaprenyldiphospho-muramoylpentapeptide beta-N-acetylglucosaminyltransferase [compost metagenome]